MTQKYRKDYLTKIKGSNNWYLQFYIKEHLTEKETYLLDYLNKNRNINLTKADLLKKIWGVNEDINTHTFCLLYTSDAADDSLRVDLGGRRIIKKRMCIGE